MPSPASELRVHGVGGSTAASLLGLAGDDEPVLVAQGGRTCFWRRPTEPRVEAYVWGGLTTGSALQPLWLFLLPFTLLNVAGWMHESDDVIASWRIRSIRYLTFALGLTLTATYVVWLASMAIDDVGYTWLPRRYGWQPRLGVLAGTALAAGLVAVVALFARRTRGGEQHPAKVGAQTLSPSRGGVLGVGGTHEEDSLLRAGFFNRSQDTNRLLVLHCVFAYVVLAVLAVAAFREGVHTPSVHHFAEYLQRQFLVIGAVQFVAIGLLVLASVSHRAAGFRVAGPAVAAALAIAVANALLAGTARALDKALKLQPGSEFLFADVMVVTLALLFLAVVVWAVRSHVVPARLADVADVPHNTAPLATPANGATESMRRRTAAFRGLARGVTRLDVVLTFSALSFFVGAGAAAVARHDNRHRFQVPLLATAGTELIAWGGVALVVFLWAKRRDPKTRKTIGIIWDLLTFWPRRFHPFAVRPYSAQAVPELRARIAALADEGRVLLSTHSQGTVLAMAAVAPLVDRRGMTRRISFVTYGSPIDGLYAMAFPAYFNAEITTIVNQEVREWRNFRRLTDPIGHDIRGVDTQVLDSPGVTADPANAPLRVPATLAERDRQPWVSVAVHSNYRNEPVIKRVVDDLRAQ